MSEQPPAPHSSDPPCCTLDPSEPVGRVSSLPALQRDASPANIEGRLETQRPSLPDIQRPSIPLAELDPPIYSGPVLGIVGADRGLGLRHISPYLLITIPRWTSLRTGDTFEYFHGNRSAPLAFDFVKPGEEVKNFFHLAIEQERVPKGFSFPVFIRVVRNGPSTPSTSDELTVFVKDTRPGLNEQPGLGYHDKLLVSLPDDLAAPGTVLTPERAALGVVMTVDYPGKRVRDKVYLYWDTITQLVILELDEDHASGAKPIEVFVPAGVIGTGSGLIPIRFQVFDEVENRSGHVEHFSQAIHLQAELDPNLLERAYFQVNLIDATSVNYDKDAGSHFRVEVVAPRTLPNGSPTPAGARIVVTLSGIRADESMLLLELPDATANPPRSTFFDVSEDIIKQLIQGSLRITWRLELPSGTVLANSQTLPILISGTLANMPAVNVVQAEAGLVDPNEPFITIEYPNPAYSPYDANNLVQLCMEVILPEGRVIEYKREHIAGAPPPPTRFITVSQAIFSRFIGFGDVRIFYRVDDGLVRVLDAGVQTIRDSESTYVQFGLRVPEMQRPEIDRVDDDDNLDPDNLFGQLDITLPYTRTSPGDRFEWRLIGSDPNGSTNGAIPLNSATAGRPVSFSLDRHYADVNRGGEIRLSYSLIPANGGRPLHSVILVVTVGKALGDLLRPEVIEASKRPDELAPEAATAGATIRVSFPQMLPTDSIRACWTGIPGIGTYCETKDGNTHKVVDFNVPAEVVGFNIAPLGRRITVQYFLLRGSREIPSLILDLLLLKLTMLPTPTIEGIGDVPLLDLSRLNGTERTMISIWHFIHHAQRIWLEYSGTYAAPEREYFEATYTNNLVTPEGVISGILPPSPVDELRKLKDGSDLFIRFWVSFDRGSNKANAVLFRERHYKVQALPGILPHPVINGASGTGPDVTVNPLSIEHDTRVTVSYPGMSSTTDRITFRWFFEDCTFYETTLDGQDGGTVVFNLTSAQVLHRSVNSVVQLMYLVVRTGVTDPIPSETQTVTVNTIAAESLPRPTLNDIQHNGSLDVDTFGKNAIAALNKWRLSRTGQRVWMTLQSPEQTSLVVLDGYPILPNEAANGIADIGVTRNWLERLATNAQFTITIKVTFDGSPYESRAVVFPISQFTKLDSWKDSFTTFRDGSLGRWVLGSGGAGGQLTSSGLFVLTPNVNNAGTVITQSFNVRSFHRYRVSYEIANCSPQADNIAPNTAVLVDGRVVLPAFSSPRNCLWNVRSGEFSVTTSKVTAFILHNYQNLGGGGGNQGGNDFYIRNVQVHRITDF